MENSAEDLCSFLHPAFMEKAANIGINATVFNFSNCKQDIEPHIVRWSIVFYAYSVPFILAVGVLGNLVSLRVFLTRNMRKLSASTYLVALSTSDIMTLLLYVLMDWIRWGLPYLNHSAQMQVINAPGFCQVLVYFGYVSRFLSAWFIVTFTVERYIGVCHPLKRKDICGSRSAQKVIVSLVVISLIIMLYKPLLTSSQEYITFNSKVQRCMPNNEHVFINFVLDGVYALFITVIPFLIISIMNALIIRKLLYRYHTHRKTNVITEESIIRMEFTIILLVISFVFIVLNLPFCIAWCKRYLSTKQPLRMTSDNLSEDFDNLEGVLMITRVIFYMNYCVNFFLYSITGAYFRQELKILVFYRNQRYSDYIKCSRYNSSPTTPQSWV